MALQFHIRIRDVHSPEVWRRILLPETFTFRQFHHAVQIAFDWENRHLYQFAGAASGGNWCVGEDNSNPLPGENPPFPAKQTMVRTFLLERNITRFLYVYDFGDNWVHDITLEAHTNELMSMPRCIGGEGATPPEDCGGPESYQHLKQLKSSQRKTAEDHRLLEHVFSRYDLFLDKDFDEYGDLREDAVPDIYGWRAFRPAACNLRPVNRAYADFRLYETQMNGLHGDGPVYDFNAILARITDMERRYDRLNAAVNNILSAEKDGVCLSRRAVRRIMKITEEDRQRLSDYLGSADWWTDRQADEDGLLPDGLKRGVLGEDTLYNLLEEADRLQKR